MMFLIRIAFWVALIALLLPTDQRQQEKLIVAASEAAQRAATFCDRNAALCERGTAYWAVFKQKLEFGARLAFDIASDHLLGRTSAGDAQSQTGSVPRHAEQHTKGTLTPADLAPDWRGKPRKGGA